MTTMRAAVSALVVLFLLVTITPAAQAQVSPTLPPTVIPVSGYLQLPSGAPRSDSVLLVASIYANRDDAAPLWVEHHVVTLTERGFYEVLVGSTLEGGLPPHLFAADGTARWLGVAAENEPEQPRIMLVSVPYAARAASADSLGGRTANDFVLSADLDAGVREALSSTETKGELTSSTTVGTLATANALVRYTSSDGSQADSALFDVNGSLGLGTASPASRFHILDGSLSEFRLQISNGAMAVVRGTPGFADIGSFSSHPLRVFTNSTQRMTIGANGFVGIGTTSPGSPFEIYNGLRGTGAPIARVYNDQDSVSRTMLEVDYPNASWTPSANPAVRVRGSGTSRELFSVLQNGNVGIGTSTPASRLHLLNAGEAEFRLQVSGGAMAVVRGTPGFADVGSFTNHPLRVFTNSTEVARVLPNGNIGIGTATPNAKLHVAGNTTITGNVVVDGNIAAKYQDVAEWVDSAEPLEAGMVVIIDETGHNRVKAASTSYDSRVAGAVSPQPGLILGEPGEGKVLVAQSGRVRIKADARYGAIKAGDLLVSSPRKGYAMRSKPIRMGRASMHRPGTVLGKALEPLASGTGEILVLLTLQ